MAFGALLRAVTQLNPRMLMQKNEWLDKNERVIGTLCQLIDTPLIDGVESLNTAKAAWEYLKKKTHQGGIATKLGALQAILATRFTEPSTFSSTITDIKDHIATIYDDMAPTREDWTIVFLLQALDGKHEWLKENLMSFLTTSGISFTSADIIAQIETKAQDTHPYTGNPLKTWNCTCCQTEGVQTEEN